MIVDPVTLGPDHLVEDALRIMERYHISGVPITDTDRRLVGILTNRDLRFEDDTAQRIGDVMTTENLITAPQGTTLEQARAILGRLSHREAAGGRRERAPLGADHGEGHPEADPAPRCHQGRPRPAAGRRGGRHRAGRVGAGRRAGSMPASTCSWSTPRMATRPASSRWCARSSASSRCRSSPATSPPVTAHGRCSTSARTRSRSESVQGRSARPESWPASASPSSPRSTIARLLQRTTTQR